MHLTPHEREQVADWVESKFLSLSLENLSAQVADWEWDRIDPWLAQLIEDDGKFARFQGQGSLEGQMVVRVVLADALADAAEPLSGLWPYSDLKRHGFNPLSDDEVAEFASLQWERLFEGDDEPMCAEFLNETMWAPRANADANSDEVGKFARLAGSCGFYVFDIRDKVVMGLDYDIRDAISDRWAQLYTDLTGNKVGTLVLMSR